MAEKSCNTSNLPKRISHCARERKTEQYQNYKLRNRLLVGRYRRVSTRNAAPSGRRFACGAAARAWSCNWVFNPRTTRSNYWCTYLMSRFVISNGGTWKEMLTLLRFAVRANGRSIKSERTVSITTQKSSKINVTYEQLLKYIHAMLPKKHQKLGFSALCAT